MYEEGFSVWDGFMFGEVNLVEVRSMVVLSEFLVLNGIGYFVRLGVLFSVRNSILFLIFFIIGKDDILRYIIVKFVRF